MEIEEIFKSIKFIDKNIPSGAKSFILHTLAKNEKIVFKGENETIRIIKQEISSFEPKIRIFSFPEDAEADPLKFSLFLFPNEENLSSLFNVHYLKLKKNSILEREKIISVLEEEGFERVFNVEGEKEYAIRGSILDFYPKGEENPYRLEFFGDRIEDIRIFAPLTQKTFQKKEEVIFRINNLHKELPCFTLNKRFPFKVIEEKNERMPLRVIPNPPLLENFFIFKREIEKLKEKNFKIFFYAPTDIRFALLKQIYPFIEYRKGNFFQGFVFEELKTAYFSEGEIYGVREKQKRLFSFGEKFEDLTSLKTGEPVIHEDYGIAYFKGIDVLKTRYSPPIDTLILLFQNNQKVYLPFYEIDKIERYVGFKEVKPDFIGKDAFFRKKLRAKLFANEFGRKLLENRARRKLSYKEPFKEHPLLKEIILSFPYDETEDQEKVWEDVKKDLLSNKITERLICGDVGFGKTEIALRASSLVALNKKQVCILVPTTILALQHFTNFQKRLKNFPITLECLTRLNSKEEKEILENLKEGYIDIVIGTHRLLQDDVVFKELGLLIIDEEHRFGVKQKEKIKFLKHNVDTLYLTATPIPRSLYIALGKITDLSLIETYPSIRQEIETILAPYSLSLVQLAIEREKHRNGQILYIHNRIKGLKEISEKISSIAGGNIRIEIVHGKMRKDKIEEIFIRFLQKEIDCLVSTSILEAGIDFPSANTLIVENPHLFGLAELHQLRGRVGRGGEKAYAYFLIPKKISESAQKRLKALAFYRHLGSGFKISLLDMKLRGSGNILGKEQHGFIKTLGYNLYFKILEEEIKRLKGERITPRTKLSYFINAELSIPRDYIDDEEEIIALYRTLFTAKEEKEIKKLYIELQDRFGQMPFSVIRIFLFALAKLYSIKEGWEKIIVFDKGVSIEKKNESKFLNIEEIKKIGFSPFC